MPQSRPRTPSRKRRGQNPAGPRLSRSKGAKKASSTSVRLRQELIELIMCGKITVGERLDQRQLAKQLKTTTAPLREVLSALESEGILVREPGVGVYCRVYTVPEIEEMVEIRGALEALAARRAAARITEKEIAELRAMALELNQPIAEGAEEKFIEKHVGFHRHVVGIARSFRLRALLDHYHLIESVLANVAASLWTPDPHDHLGIVEAIGSRDPSRAERAMYEHIAPTYERRFVEVRKRFGEGPILTLGPYRR